MNAPYTLEYNIYILYHIIIKYIAIPIYMHNAKDNAEHKATVRVWPSSNIVNLSFQF